MSWVGQIRDHSFSSLDGALGVSVQFKLVAPGSAASGFEAMLGAPAARDLASRLELDFDDLFSAYVAGLDAELARVKSAQVGGGIG